MKIWRVQKGKKYIYSDHATYCDGGQSLQYGYNDKRIVFVYALADNDIIDNIIGDVKYGMFFTNIDTLLIGTIDDDYVCDAGDEDGLVCLWDKISWEKAYKL